MTGAAAGTILVIKLGALGDFVQALGPMRAIRRHHPGARVILLTTAPFAALAKDSGYLDEIWLDSRPRWFEPSKILAFRKRLNGAGISRVYDLQNNDRTALYLKLFSPRPEWVGAAPGASHRNAALSRTAGKSFDGHVETLALAGISGIAVDDLRWMTGDAAISLPKPYVLIVPGSSPDHPRKRWPADHYAALCRQLLAGSVLPVLIGAKGESETLAQIERGAPGVRNLCGVTSLSDIAALARNAAAAVGNDTGPMHLIAPTGCPSLILFSEESNPARHAPPGNNVVTRRQARLDDLAAEDVWPVLAVLAHLVIDPAKTMQEL